MEIYREIRKEAEKRDENVVLSGTLINNGTVEAIIPQLLVTYYDESDAVVWTEAFYIEESIRPQREYDFEVKLKPMEQVRQVEVDGVEFTNLLDGGIVTDFGSDLPWTERIDAPQGLGYASVRVSVNYFVGSD